jgi:peptidoglycan hydrolase-like protein with peptidoglycan-binding domain
LLIVLTGKGTDTASDQDTMLAEVAMAQLPSETNATSAPAASLTVPVYAPISITNGISAAIVMDIQTKLMELGYMGEDAPDGIFGETTQDAVMRFQTQHGIEATGTVDEATFSLLFSDEAQYYTLTVGIENEDVLAMQERLVELDYMSDATGYFGDTTQAAVKKFQKMNGLSEDGKIGKDTRELLYSSDAVANAYSLGETSDDILKYQKRLKALGYLFTEPDGVFGNDTKAAVQRFQESSGLVSDGYIGPQTRAALMSDDAQGNALSIGAEGDDVLNIQKRLKELGYISKTTGYFGSETDTAVRSFQYNNGLSVDGKVGANTMSKLNSSSAKKSTGVDVTGANIESFISVAESKLGSRYVLGGKGPTVFDCSGFAYWCLNQVGIKQSYMTSYTWRSCTKYTRIDSMSKLKRGDIIIYYGHVAICAGNGWMIDASSSNGKVVKRKYTNSSYWSRNFYCGYRVF